MLFFQDVLKFITKSFDCKWLWNEPNIMLTLNNLCNLKWRELIEGKEIPKELYFNFCTEIVSNTSQTIKVFWVKQENEVSGFHLM